MTRNEFAKSLGELIAKVENVNFTYTGTDTLLKRATQILKGKAEAKHFAIGTQTTARSFAAAKAANEFAAAQFAMAADIKAARKATLAKAAAKELAAQLKIQFAANKKAALDVGKIMVKAAGGKTETG